MSRPTSLHVGGTVYWVLRTRDPDTQVLKDADSTPTLAVRKNGASTGDSPTITKRSATTGIYDCSYNPASEVEGDKFTLEESAIVTGTTTPSATYTSSWEFVVEAVERGTDGANTTAPDNAGINSAKTAAESADNKLTAGRLSRIDRIPDVAAGAATGLSIVGSEMTLSSAVLAALFSDTDTAALVDAIIARIESDLDGADVSVAAIAVAVRDAILNRLLAGNHDTAGSVGKFLQNLDVLLSTRATPAQVTAALDAISATALARFVTVDTGQTSAAAGSVAKLAQEAGGGGGGSGDALEATSQTILGLIQGVMNGDNSAVRAELDSAAKLVLGSLAAQHFGAISNAGTATETYVATEFGQTFTVTHSGLESDGDRSEATRVAS